ncbi:MAG TPA: hypothetical protein VKJ65_13015, partial [Phycisphaerae bacterium]|nr:hypothetical protein [Phycisphaerae bacterium]
MSLKGVTLLGPSGETIISGLNVDTQLSLLHLLSDRQNLGKIAISIDQVQVQSQGNGNINLLEAIASKTSEQSQQPSTPTATSGQHAPSRTSATTLPPIAAQIDCQIKSFSMTSPNAPELKAENISFSTGIDTSGTGPTTTHLSAAVGVGSATPTQIALDANLEIFNHNQLLPLEQIAGGVESKIDGLDLSIFEPILSAEGIGLVASGKLTLDMSTTLANKPESGQIKGTVSISGLELSGALLKGDDAKIGDVQIPIDANWGPGSFSINQLAFESSPANISVSGSGSPAAIDAAIHHLSGTNGMAQFKVDSTVQLANLLDMFPNLSGPLVSAISLPANTHFTGGETKTTAQITLGGAAASTGAGASSAQATLPQASGTLQISSQPLQWNQSSGENYPQEASLNGQLTFDTSGKPIQIQLLVSSGEGQANPMQVSLAGNVTMLANQNILPLDEWNGPLELKVEQFQLPDLARFNLPIVPTGTLNGDIKMDAEAGGKGNISGELSVDQLALSGSMLNGDQPQIGTLAVPIDVDWNGENLTINQLGYKNTATTLNMSGTTSISSLKAMMKPGGDWGNTDLKLQATYDLAAICKELPHVLRLSDKNLIVNSGTENVNFEFSNTTVDSKCTLMAGLTNFAGQWQQRPFTIDPLLLQATAARSNQIWSLTSAELSQGTSPYELDVQVTPGTGQIQAYALDCQADLAKVVAEVGQIIDLKGAAAAGQLDWKTQANNIFSPTIGYTTALNWSNASIVPGTGKTPINEPQITLNAQGNVDMMGDIFNGLTSNFDFTNSTISITQSQLQLKLDAQRNLEIPTLALNISNVSLARLTELLTPMVKNMDQYNIGGQISNSVVDASYSPGSINISKVHLAANNITVSSNMQSLSGVQ